jgi:bifunctional DNA-binding transcriptional regulator/antitoxin component of YhaV-PrlF toxin-antitoxin module
MADSLGYSIPVTTRITGKNQVTVPAEIVKKEGMRPGTRLEWRTTDREHVLEIHVLPDAATLAAALRGRGNTHRRKDGSAVDRLIAERARDDDSSRE